MPSSQSETKFILSNTTNAAVTATIEVDGTAPKQQQPATILLNPHQARVLDIMRDLIGRQNGTLHKTGGISITHNGTPGAIMARMLISQKSSGYSSVVNFVDPTNQRSSKLNGGGLRLGLINGDKLEQIVVARNVGDEQTTVRGRIPYTNGNNDVVFVTIPEIQLNPNEVETLNLKQAVRQANIPANVTFAGLELEYTTAPGSVVMNALSVSESGQQVFQVPLLDPEKMPSSAGGFPWKADGDYTTVVFIKNESNAPKKYIAKLTYDGGGYVQSPRELKPGQTVAVDFKQLRDTQTPDSMNRQIPLNIERGQASWTMIGADNNTMSGRSEQVNTRRGVSSTYACYNCCPDSIYSDGGTTPYSVETEIGFQQHYGFQAATRNCYGGDGLSFIGEGYNWSSSNYSIAQITYNGTATAMDGGTSYLTGYFENVIWQSGILGCHSQNDIVYGSAEMEVRPDIIMTVPETAEDGDTVEFRVSVQNGTATAYQWSFEPASGGNNPQVNFSNSTGTTTTAKAHWFAKPNQPCTNLDSKHTIKVKVSFQNRSPITKDAPFTVCVGSNWGGVVREPKIEGHPKYEYDNERKLWTIVGSGDLQRIPQPIVIREIPETSQFYNKIYKHEEAHEKQWKTGMLSDLYTVDSLMPHLLVLTDPGARAVTTEILSSKTRLDRGAG